MFLGAIEKFQKAPIRKLLKSVSPYVRMKQLGSHNNNSYVI